MFTNYSETELSQIILNGIEEDLHLDYKAAGSLEKTDLKKKEISKDVSSFANSDGGIIIYGIKEFNELAKKHLPEKIDPLNRTQISKEWLEQVINSNIQPKIEGLKIHPIQLHTSVNDAVYVVKIPKSNTVHQANNKKYYKRYNFESVAMEDYEIKDILNRTHAPDVNLVLDDKYLKANDWLITFPIVLRNNSLRIARDITVTVEFNDNSYDSVNSPDFNDISHLNPGKHAFVSRGDIKIYYGSDSHTGHFNIQLKQKILRTSITVTILGDNMAPKIHNFEIHTIDNIPKYIF